MSVFRHIFASMLCIALAAVLVFACVCGRYRLTDREEYRIYTSCYPVYALSALILKDIPGMNLYMLTQPTDEYPNEYSLSDWDEALLATADAAIFMGGGFETYASYYSSDSTIIINLLGGLVLKDNSEFAEVLDFSEDTLNNPWLFMSTEGAMDITEAITANMTTIDEAYTAQYIRNMNEAYELLAAMQQQFDSDVPVALAHEGFAYLADELGLNTVLIIKGSTGYDTEVAEALDSSGAELVLADRQTYRYYEELGFDTVCLDLMMAHGAGEGADGYFEAMQHNIELIKAALEKYE